jgi:hypothetical protein
MNGMNGTSSAVILLAGWCIAAVFNYSLVFGHFQSICSAAPAAARRHRGGDMWTGVYFAALGPAAWLVFLGCWVLGEGPRLRNIKFW